MFDQRPEEVVPIDFDEFADHLVEQGLEVSPAEIHGCICGLLAAGGRAEAEWGLSRVCQSLDITMTGDLAGLSLRLYSVSAAALEDEEFDFYPLLPEDEVEIASRIEAMASWCSGFLVGYAGASSGSVPKVGDSAEILADFAAIAEAQMDEEATDEESEESYAELVEYLRFAALNVYLDSRANSDDRGPDSSAEGSLH
jgi:uncharacterized protein